MKKFYKELKRVLAMGGKPGWLLLGYYIVQIVFARNKTDVTAVDGSAIIFAGYAILSGYIALMDLRKDDFSRFFFSLLLNKTCIKWFFIYSVICAISALWSIQFTLSAYRAVECIGFMLLNASVMKNLMMKFDIQGIMMWCVTYAFVMMAFTVANHSSSGIMTLLYFMQFPSTIFFYLIFYFAPKKIMKYPMMLIALACQSTTGYIGMALGMCSLMFGNKKYRKYGIILALTIGVAIGVMGIDGLLNNTIFAAKGASAITSEGSFNFDAQQTSGRSEIWGPAIAEVYAASREWYGFGFVASETYFVQNVIGGQVIGMHNGFLSAFVGTGMFGLIAFSLFYIGYAFSVFKCRIPKTYKSLLIASFCVVTMHTLGNPGLGFRVYGTWMPAMFFVMLTQVLLIKTRYMNHYQPPYTVAVKNTKMRIVPIQTKQEQSKSSKQDDND